MVNQCYIYLDLRIQHGAAKNVPERQGKEPTWEQCQMEMLNFHSLGFQVKMHVFG